MSSTTSAPQRRDLSGQRADKVDRLVDAALDELRDAGYEGLTVRNVAARAGVAPATAYTFFGSKDHLVAEVFWRRLQELPEVKVDRRRGPVGRVAAALHDVGDLVSDEPALAAAATVAVLAHDPDVERLRTVIGVLLAQRLSEALGDDARPEVLRVLTLALSGALLQAGMGYFGYDELADRMEEVAGLVLGSRS